MLEQGVPQAEIARRLGLATPTVAYHAGRLRAVAAEPRVTCEPDPRGSASAVSQVDTRSRVADLLAEGLTRSEIAARLGIAKSTVSYHARRLGEPVDERAARRYDWEAIQHYYDAGHSVAQCQERFGFSRQTWHAAVRRGAVTARPHAMPIVELCVKGTPRARYNLKRRLLVEGLKDARCERCRLEQWLGQPVPLSLHHRNGDRHDNRLENLEILCPNCHALTDNFAGRNRRASGSGTAQEGPSPLRPPVREEAA